ncbi:alpha/beta hydrolase [Pseudomonas sp. AN-1]|uniref:alpha/beta hydrolase family protein n=1 Tax=Pseudomonas sp. AN-1 TaxID=3096605 RepID=UPI002A6AA7AC|nr:alpha/beta hydrolase [Pseudomonas sp. AN-1]WPP46039.1 alpha/beta hydrolase [Pseudomonas sp. AN-1]
MPRLFLLLTLLLATALAQAAPTRILQWPMALRVPGGSLHGTLTLPERDGALPVVLMIAGSGPTDRDGNNPEGGHNDSLRLLARELAGRGIASLRYDKRGVAASRAAAPREEELSVAAYVADAVAWGQLLKSDPRFSRLILLGHSEGALIASLAAAEAGADALVSLAGVARPVGTVLREQLEGRLPPALAAETESVLAALEQGRQTAEVTPALHVLLRPSVQPYLISLLRQRPAEAFARVTVPALIVQGTRDFQVGVEEALLLQQARPEAQLLLVEGMDHVLRIVPSGARPLASYDDPRLPLAAELVEGLARFILP